MVLFEFVYNLMLYYKMSLSLLRTAEASISAMIKEVVSNTTEMKKSTSDIADIQKDIKDLKEKNELQDTIHAEDREFTQEDIKGLKEKDEAHEAEAVLIIADLKAKILALEERDEAQAIINAENELEDTENAENEIVLQEKVKVLQEAVDVLQVNEEREETEKVLLLNAEIAMLELRLSELLMNATPVVAY